MSLAQAFAPAVEAYADLPPRKDFTADSPFSDYEPARAESDAVWSHPLITGPLQTHQREWREAHDKVDHLERKPKLRAAAEKSIASGLAKSVETVKQLPPLHRRHIADAAKKIYDIAKKRMGDSYEVATGKANYNKRAADYHAALYHAATGDVLESLDESLPLDHPAYAPVPTHAGKQMPFTNMGTFHGGELLTKRLPGWNARKHQAAAADHDRAAQEIKTQISAEELDSSKRRELSDLKFTHDMLSQHHIQAYRRLSKLSPHGWPLDGNESVNESLRTPTAYTFLRAVFVTAPIDKQRAARHGFAINHNDADLRNLAKKRESCIVQVGYANFQKLLRQVNLLRSNGFDCYLILPAALRQRTEFPLQGNFLRLFTDKFVRWASEGGFGTGIEGELKNISKFPVINPLGVSWINDRDAQPNIPQNKIVNSQGTNPTAMGAPSMLQPQINEAEGGEPIHHVAEYNGKRIVMDYIANPKDQFKRACQRIVDNGASGVVHCPDGKRYAVSSSSRKATLIKESAIELVEQMADDAVRKIMDGADPLEVYDELMGESFIETKQPWEMTKAEFHEHRNARMQKEHGLDRSEVDELYPVGSHDHHHYKVVMDANTTGEKIPDRVLDDRIDVRHRLLHDFNDKYNEYISPEVRKQKRVVLPRLGRPAKIKWNGGESTSPTDLFNFIHNDPRLNAIHESTVIKRIGELRERGILDESRLPGLAHRLVNHAAKLYARNVLQQEDWRLAIPPGVLQETAVMLTTIK